MSLLAMVSEPSWPRVMVLPPIGSWNDRNEPKANPFDVDAAVPGKT